MKRVLSQRIKSVLIGSMTILFVGLQLACWVPMTHTVRVPSGIEKAMANQISQDDRYLLLPVWRRHESDVGDSYFIARPVLATAGDLRGIGARLDSYPVRQTCNVALECEGVLHTPRGMYVASSSGNVFWLQYGISNPEVREYGWHLMLGSSISCEWLRALRELFEDPAPVKFDDEDSQSFWMVWGKTSIETRRDSGSDSSGAISRHRRDLLEYPWSEPEVGTMQVDFTADATASTLEFLDTLRGRCSVSANWRSLR